MGANHISPDSRLRYAKVAVTALEWLREQIDSMPHGLSHVAREMGWSVGELEVWLTRPTSHAFEEMCLMLGIVGEALRRKSRFARLDGGGNLGDVSPDDKSRIFEDPSITKFKEIIAELFSSPGDDPD